jgi:hypothetical protein
MMAPPIHTTVAHRPVGHILWMSTEPQTLEEVSMSTPRSIRNVIGATAIASLLSIAAASTPAAAASLFFFKGPTKASNERVCLTFARDQARRHNLQHIEHNNLAVSGTRGDFFAVMTCVGTTVVVMVAGNTGENGSPLAQELFDAIRHEICIDGC